MIVLVDIDHCVCDGYWRDSMIGITDWDSYHLASKDDAPIKEIVDLINSMEKAGHAVIGFTSRPEKWRKLTNEWLVKHEVKISELVMRRNDDFRKATEIKEDIVRSPIFSGYGIALVIDDRQDVCETINNMGITTMQVRHK